MIGCPTYSESEIASKLSSFERMLRAFFEDSTMFVHAMLLEIIHSVAPVAVYSSIDGYAYESNPMTDEDGDTISYLSEDMAKVACAQTFGCVGVDKTPRDQVKAEIRWTLHDDDKPPQPCARTSQCEAATNPWPLNADSAAKAMQALATWHYEAGQDIDDVIQGGWYLKENVKDACLLEMSCTGITRVYLGQKFSPTTTLKRGGKKTRRKTKNKKKTEDEDEEGDDYKKRIGDAVDFLRESRLRWQYDLLLKAQNACGVHKECSIWMLVRGHKQKPCSSKSSCESELLDRFGKNPNLSAKVNMLPRLFLDNIAPLHMGLSHVSLTHVFYCMSVLSKLHNL